MYLYTDMLIFIVETPGYSRGVSVKNKQGKLDFLSASGGNG